MPICKIDIINEIYPNELNQNKNKSESENADGYFALLFLDSSFSLLNMLTWVINQIDLSPR